MDNITIDLIDCPVGAFGFASGPLSGRIAALFYRCKSIGGTDYISDLLIAPEAGTSTRPGDSGTMWCMVDEAAEQTDPLRPMALQWGGHVFVDGGKNNVAQGLALATFVSTICRELDVDVLRGIHTDLPEYWGDVGHYTIGAKACQLLVDDKLSALMMANLDRVSYGDDNLAAKSFKTASQQRFSPLADVPDKVWKRPGSPAGRGNHENPNHFADLDKPDSNQQTLLELTERSLAMIWESAWKQGTNSIAELGPVDTDALIALYENPAWAKSMTLDEIGPSLIGGPVAPAQPVEPAQPAQPAEPAEPVNPAGPAGAGGP